MADQDVSSALDHLECLVGGLSEGGTRWHAGEVSVGHEDGHPVGDYLIGPYFHHQNGEVGVVLGRDRIECFVQPCPVPTGHDYCHHGGRGLLGPHTKRNSVAGPPGSLRVGSSDG